MKKLLTLAFFVLLQQYVWSQCTVTSSDGYSVHIAITPKAIVVPPTCPFGYTYNVTLDYSITFSGINIPGSLSTLQATLSCGSQTLFYDLYYQMLL